MSPFFQVAFLVCGLLDAALALRVLRGGREGEPLGLARVVRAALAVAALGCAQALALAPFGLNPFGAMQLGWIVLAYVVPLCGLVVLGDHLRGRAASGAARVVAVVALLAVPVAVSAQLVTPFDLRLETATVELPAERAGREPLRVGVLADLQATSVTEYEREAVARLMAREPDLILVPGDIFHGPAECFEDVLPQFQALLQQLEAPGGVWVVPGNTDHQEGLPRLLEGSSAKLLRDKTISVRVRDRELRILGVDERAHATSPRGQAMVAAFGEVADPRSGEPVDDDAIRIVLAHRPRVVDLLPPDSRVDLVVAGHTHGGQVALPGIGPLLTLSPLPNRIGAGGLHARHGNALYVSRGVGMERINAPRIRLGVPPEISVITLTDAGTALEATP